MLPDAFCQDAITKVMKLFSEQILERENTVWATKAGNLYKHFFFFILQKVIITVESFTYLYTMQSNVA